MNVPSVYSNVRQTYNLLSFSTFFFSAMASDSATKLEVHKKEGTSLLKELLAVHSTGMPNYAFIKYMGLEMSAWP